jgi:hypothetical protein
MNNKKITIATLALSLSMMIMSCRSTDNAVDGKDSSGNSSFRRDCCVKVGIIGEEFAAGSDNLSPTASVKGSAVSGVLKTTTKQLWWMIRLW